MPRLPAELVSGGAGSADELDLGSRNMLILSNISDKVPMVSIQLGSKNLHFHKVKMPHLNCLKKATVKFSSPALSIHESSTRLLLGPLAPPYSPRNGTISLYRQFVKLGLALSQHPLSTFQEPFST